MPSNVPKPSDTTGGWSSGCAWALLGANLFDVRLAWTSIPYSIKLIIYDYAYFRRDTL